MTMKHLPGFRFDEGGPMASLKRDRHDLTEMFARFNRDYFGGRKPRYRVLRQPWRGGYCDIERRRILLPLGMEGDELAAVLLHEMCHIGCPYHGRRFQERMRRLIPLVSASVAAGIELYLGMRGETLRETISSRLHSIAVEYPATPWKWVRRVIGPELGPTFNARERRKKQRRLAGARREWARLSRDYLELGVAPRRLDRVTP
jgi:hypothetical protein